MMHLSSRGKIVTLLDGVITGTSVGVNIPISSQNIRIHVRASGVVTAGGVEIEEAQTDDYAGTWSAIVTMTPVTNSEIVAHIGGTFGVVRARISPDVAGGATVIVELVSD